MDGHGGLSGRLEVVAPTGGGSERSTRDDFLRAVHERAAGLSDQGLETW